MTGMTNNYTDTKKYCENTNCEKIVGANFRHSSSQDVKIDTTFKNVYLKLLLIISNV